MNTIDISKQHNEVDARYSVTFSHPKISKVKLAKVLERGLETPNSLYVTMADSYYRAEDAMKYELDLGKLYFCVGFTGTFYNDLTYDEMMTLVKTFDDYGKLTIHQHFENSTSFYNWQNPPVVTTGPAVVTRLI